MFKGHRPHEKFPWVGAARPERRPGGYHNPREGTALTGAQLHSQDHSAPYRVECRAGGTVAARPTATVNVGSMTAGSHRPVPRAPQSRGSPPGAGRVQRRHPQIGAGPFKKDGPAPPFCGHLGSGVLPFAPRSRHY
jgi:hypothetical protein